MKRTLIATGWLLASLSFFAAPAKAQFFLFDSKSFFLGVGAYFPNILATAGSDNGSSSLIGSTYGELSIAYRIPLGESLTFIPTVTGTLLGSGNIDGDASNRYYSFVLPISFPIVGGLEFKTGVGLLIYRISGSGGSVTLNNGTGTLDFNLPAQAKESKFLILDVGVGFPLFGDFRFDLNAYVTSLLSTRRAFSIATRMSWGIF